MSGMYVEPVMDGLLTDEEIQFQEMVRRFMKQEVEPLVPKMQRNGEPDRELLRKLGELGLLGCCFSEEHGGSGGSLVMRAITSIETARVDAGLDITLFSLLLFCRAVDRYGSLAQKEKYLRPVLEGRKIGAICITEPLGGSNALGGLSVAKRDGDQFVINGSKTYCTNAPIADFFVVIVRTSGEPGRINGGTWFLLEREMDGLSTGQPFDKLGMRSSPTGEVFFSDISVGEGQMLGQLDRGFYDLMEGLDVERVLEGASTLGIAEACLEAVVPYALERVVFGKPIASFQLIQEKIAAMVTGIEMTRPMLFKLLRDVERGRKVTRESSVLKLYSSQMCMQSALDAVQVLGGNGYNEEYKVARFFRDAKHHEIGAGTSEIMKLVIAREALGMKSLAK